MVKKSSQKFQFSQEELNNRLALGETAAELEKVKKQIGVEPVSKSRSTEVPIGSLTGVGLSAEQAYQNAVTELDQFLNALGQYVFSPSNAKILFRNNKIAFLVSLLKQAKMDMVAFAILSIFKDRVKQRNGNKVPTVKEKAGIFSKTVERPLKPEEIAAQFEIEIDLPSGEPRPLAVVGTQSSLLNYLFDTLLKNEDIVDPTKKTSRRVMAAFMQGAGLIRLDTTDPGEKQFLICLLTSDKIQPRSKEDKDLLLKFTTLLKRGTRWLNDKMNPTEEPAKSGQSQNQPSGTITKNRPS